MKTILVPLLDNPGRSPAEPGLAPTRDACLAPATGNGGQTAITSDSAFAPASVYSGFGSIVYGPLAFRRWRSSSLTLWSDGIAKDFGCIGPGNLADARVVAQLLIPMCAN